MTTFPHHFTPGQPVPIKDSVHVCANGHCLLHRQVGVYSKAIQINCSRNGVLVCVILNYVLDLTNKGSQLSVPYNTFVQFTYDLYFAVQRWLHNHGRVISAPRFYSV